MSFTIAKSCLYLLTPAMISCMPAYKPSLDCGWRAQVPPLAQRYAAAHNGATVTEADPALPGASGSGVTEIALASSSCGGACPIYSVTLLSDGSVSYTGHGCVPHPGEFRGHIRPSAFLRLQELASDIGFFDLEEAYSSRISDGPIRHVAVTKNGRQKIIQDYYTAPARLWAFEVAIIHVLRTATWEDKTPVLPTSSP